jgi:hypothetical protein
LNFSIKPEQAGYQNIRVTKRGKMNNISRGISYLLLAALFICATGAKTFVLAQDGRITCESTFNRYNYCRVDTENRVRLVRELSRKDCDQNSTWGYDRRGIWVDRGCRAEFEYGKGASGTGVAIGAGIAGGVILAAILASRKSGSEKYNDSTSNLGFNKGHSDAAASKSSDYGRYKGKYNSNYESDFIRGYNEGYRGNSSNSGNSGNRNDAYDDGYKRGRQDAEDNRRSDYSRYDDQYNSRTERDFRDGYDRGFRDNVEHADDRHDEDGKVPSWMVGTFRGYSSNTRTFIDMTIYGDGRIWSRGVNNSYVANGLYSNGYLFIGGTNYRVIKNGNGFNSQNLSNTSDLVAYTRLY